MKVYLLGLDDERCVFYTEGPETVAEFEDAAPRSGPRGWVERKYKSLQVILRESESGVGLHMRRAWEWLQRRASPDEPVLRSLRGAQAIKLYHPLTLTERESLSLWADYLASRRRRHTIGLIVNGLISPLTVLLTPIPGPNVIGYWFVYRLICHLLALLGVRRAGSRRVTTQCLALSELDGSFGGADGERLAGVAARFGLNGLEAFIKRATGERTRPRKTSLAAS
ncbi:MAG TPA: hypothetical protein VD966_02150 [Pyrinomonadaceae bacterium]|nr:hypothetical protein [Pyrinomonadaceae bacterium]